jgi:hypothetical protein
MPRREDNSMWDLARYAWVILAVGALSGCAPQETAYMKDLDERGR